MGPKHLSDHETSHACACLSVLVEGLEPAVARAKSGLSTASTPSLSCGPEIPRLGLLPVGTCGRFRRSKGWSGHILD